eukprot:m.21764 g.21764  ORF g.21764 m.21764 type:complete len:111 (-) comp7222_c1_seq1:271-603(-)
MNKNEKIVALARRKAVALKTSGISHLESLYRTKYKDMIESQEIVQPDDLHSILRSRMTAEALSETVDELIGTGEITESEFRSRADTIDSIFMEEIYMNSALASRLSSLSL